MPDTPRAVCPSDCDDDCDVACHENHAVPWKRHHDPNTCPSGNRAPMPDATPPTTPHRCPSCDTETEYQAFSGGREWYCPNCEENGSYPEGAAPRRVAMLRTPEGAAALRQEMRQHLGTTDTPPGRTETGATIATAQATGAREDTAGDNWLPNVHPTSEPYAYQQPAYTWAQSVASTGAGPTAQIDIDIHAPSHDQPIPVEIPLAEAETLHAMLGGVIAEHAGQHRYDTAIDTAQQVAAHHTDDALRDRIAALFRHPPGTERLGDATPGEIADAVLAELAPELVEHAENQGVIQVLRRHRDTAEATPARVRDLHTRSDQRRPLDLGLTPIAHCAGCGHDWPCETAQILDTPEPTP